MTDVMELLPAPRELPVSPVSGLEPMLTITQLCKWTGYSRSTIQNARQRTDDPWPTIGTIAGPRFLPSEVIAWMRREYTRSTAGEDFPA